MGKKISKLSMSDKFFIEHHREKMNVNEIANEIGRTVPQVRGYISSLPKIDTEETTETNDHTGVMKVKGRNRLFARREKNGQTIATIMTPGASEEADDTRFENEGNRYIDGAVIRIHND